MPEELSGRGIHSFLAQLALRADPVSGLEQVMVVGVDPGRRVHLMNLLLSVRVNVYLTQQRLSACLGELPAEGLSPVVEVPEKAFAARRSILAVPQIDHVTHLGGISLLDR